MDRRTKKTNLDIDQRRQLDRRILSEIQRQELSYLYHSVYIKVLLRASPSEKEVMYNEYVAIAAAQAVLDRLNNEKKTIQEFAKSMIRKGYSLSYEDGSIVPDTVIEKELSKLA